MNKTWRPCISFFNVHSMNFLKAHTFIVITVNLVYQGSVDWDIQHALYSTIGIAIISPVYKTWW